MHQLPMKSPRLSLLVAVIGALSGSISLQADHPLGGNLGTVHFEVRGGPEARERVVRGVKLVHHMVSGRGS
jgi:hypothetical protein